MKNFFSRIIGLGFIVILLLSASKPSIEGRVIVANEGELPPGLYIRAATFLPGDTVVITNPATKISIEVLVFGTSTAGEGVAAVLSPDVAKKLFISKDSNSIVQITKIGADEESIRLSRALGSISEPPADVLPEDFVDDSQPPADVLPEDFIDDSQPHVKEELAKILDLPLEGKPIADTSARAPVFEDVAIVKTPITPQEEIPISPEEENIEDYSVFSPFADMDDPFASSDVEQENIELQDPVLENHLVPEVIPQEVVVVDPITEGITEGIPITEPKTEPVIAVKDEEVIPTEVLADNIAVKDEEVIPTEALADDIAVKDKEVIPTEVFADDIAVKDEEVIPTEVLADDSAVIENTPNVLIPAQEHPPEIDEVVVTDKFEPELLPDYFIHYEPEVAVIPTETPETEPHAIDTLAFVPAIEDTGYYQDSVIDIEEYVIDNIQSFGGGNFFIQLATYRDTENINKVISEYANNYPVRLVKSETLSNAYQVLVGPLNQDEYTIVLRRFMAWGFEDAFLRLAN